MDESNGRAGLKPIPAFASREAEAEFWDTHDLTEYFDFDNPISVGRIDSGLRQVTFFVDTETLELAKDVAAEKQMDWKWLLHLWLVERRDAEQAKRRAESNEQQRESA